MDAPSPCLGDDEIIQLQRGSLPPERALAVRRHVVSCLSCLKLMRAVLESGPASDPATPAPDVAPPADPERPWQPPPRFDDFEEVTWIGRGAMGQVFRAFDVRLGRPVALKFISASAPSAELRERFQQEARTLAQLQHPNIATAYQAGEVQGHPFLVTEWVVGQRLDEVQGPVSWERLLRLALGLARGLAAAHRKGILHRDIKPSNIMVQEGDEPKLLDFGLAKALDDVQSRVTRTEAGVRVGTPRYMAPEVFRGQPATRASDVYSLGLVLYELCVGGPVGEGEQIPLTRRAPSLSPALAAIVDRCLRADAALRFASAEALVEALERLAMVGSAASPGGNPYRGLRPFEAEHRALFFGRGGDLRAIIERLRLEPQLLLAGDSGVGKSSLCRAGVVPRVLEGDLADGRDYTAVQLIPGRHPLQALCAALSPLVRMNEQALQAWVRSDPTAPRRALTDGLRPGQGALLLVDQTEELITLSDPSEAATLAQVLRDLSMHLPLLRLVLAVRTDFLSHLVTLLEGMDERLQRTIYFVRPLSRAAVREAIVGPARHLGVGIDASVLQQAEAVALEPGGLPLVQFALAELWEARDPTTAQLTAQGLEDLGGMAGALARHADRVMATLPRPQQDAARRLLLSLVSEVGTRARRSEADLALVGADARVALQALVGGRLVLAGQAEGKPTYELTHEVLIKSWPLLSGLLVSDAGQRAARERLRVAAVEWQRLGGDGGALWGSKMLHEASTLESGELPALDRSFLVASRRANRLRRVLLPLTLLVPLVGTPLVKWGLDILTTRRAIREAEGRLAVGLAQVAQTRALRLRSYQRFDLSGDNNDPEATRAWAEANRLAEHADSAFITALQQLEAAPGRGAIQAVEGQILCARYRLLSWYGDTKQRRTMQEQLRLRRAPCIDQQSRVRVLNQSGEPLRIRVARYQEQEGALLVPVVVRDWTEVSASPTEERWLALEQQRAGSYVLQVSDRRGAARFAFPYLLEGQPECQVRLLPQPAQPPPEAGQAQPRQDPDEPIPCSSDIAVPVEGPAGYVYVPAGWSYLGSASNDEDLRHTINAPPAHPIHVGAFYIGRMEVTISDWLRFLEEQPAQAAAHLPAGRSRTGSGEGLRLTRVAAGWRYTFAESHAYQAESDAALRYQRKPEVRGGRWECFPIAAVNEAQIRGFLRWLDGSGRLPGARLCDEWEWIRAARGADLRLFPGGNRLDDALVNMDSSYERRDFGPDEVQRHAEFLSPFGVLNMTGNVRELVTVRGAPDRSWVLGGSWYTDSMGGRLDNRDPGNASASSNDLGFRVCAPFPLPRPAIPAPSSSRRSCSSDAPPFK